MTYESETNSPPSPIKIRHHYVPVCYLRMFTPTQSAEDCLICTDLKSTKKWPSSPNAVAFENGYNSVEGDLRSDAVEDVFASVEMNAAPILHKMIFEKKFPQDPIDFNWLMNFFALLQARTKPNRKAIHDMYLTMSEAMINLVTSTPERFASHIAEIEESGISILELLEGRSLEDIRPKMRDGSLKLEANIHNNYYLDKMFNQFDTVLHILSERHWRIFDFSDCDIKLLTSDDPVSIVWREKMPLLQPPGFGMPKTLVIIPLDPKTAMIGAFEPELLNLKVSEELALKINHITLGHTFRFTYSCDNNPQFAKATHPGLSKGNFADFIQQRAKAIPSNSYAHQIGPLVVLSRQLEPNHIII